MCLQPKPIRVSDKTGIPLDVLAKRGLTAKQVERMERINDTDLPRASTQPRSRDESIEEKRARKQAIKSERKVCTAASHLSNLRRHSFKVPLDSVLSLKTHL